MRLDIYEWQMGGLASAAQLFSLMRRSFHIILEPWDNPLVGSRLVVHTLPCPLFRLRLARMQDDNLDHVNLIMCYLAHVVFLKHGLWL